LLFLLAVFVYSATASPMLIKHNSIWMLNLEALANHENYTIEFHPVEKRLSLKGNSSEWVFVVGFPYFLHDGKTESLSAPVYLEKDKVFAPAEETVKFFQKEFNKNITLDTIKNLVLFTDLPKAKPKPIIPQTSKKETAGTREVKTIVIDPGHGGKDPGALGKKSQEKDIVLSVAKLLKKKLTKEGFNVKLTREKDVFIELSQRANLANKWDGDLFISLHCNAVDGIERQKRTEGYHFYVLRAPESEEDKAIARRENKVASLYGDKEAKEELSPLEWFKLEARLEKYKQNSYMYTEELLNSFNNNGKIKQLGTGVGGAGFMVLVGALMPAVLVELGFITHPKDENYMNSAKGQEDLANRITKSIIEYKKAVNDYRKTLQH
jgi:N-acetylmuramoyl-L-alanine amidase